jgi:tetratricopeptide (TPR) repeat protein
MNSKIAVTKCLAGLAIAMALCLSGASPAFAKSYGDYDILKVLKKTDNPPGGSVDLVYVDAIMDDLRTHADSYPTRFDSAADQAKAKRDVLGLIGILDVLAKAPDVHVNVLIRLGVLGHIGYNLEIPDIGSSAQLYFAKALTLQPEHPLANYRMGLFLAQSNQMPMAVNFFENAKRLGYKSALYSLGLAYMSLKQTDKALENLTAYQALYPNDPNVPKFIKAIKQGNVSTVELGKP